ncbi:MAG: hypothetical protein L3J13_04525 [Devosiaceae bacterium]|nr:hypothetical protein [Devosiaceae bacterium]
MAFTPLHQRKGNGYQLPHLNSQILADNAAVVANVVNNAGHDLAGVCKGVFQQSIFLDQFCTMPISRLYVSNAKQDLPLEGKVVSLYPSTAISCLDWPSHIVRTELDMAVVTSLLSARDNSKPLKLMVPVLTSENREGLPPAHLYEFCQSLINCFGKSIHIEGFLANYGCIEENISDIGEIGELIKLVANTAKQIKAPSIICSIGGSAVLPILKKLPTFDGVQIEIRVGEAILAGTVPGSEPLPGLNSTAVLYGNIIQKRVSASEGILLVDQGTRRLAGKSKCLTPQGLSVRHMSSEQTVLVGSAELVTSLNSCMEFQLTYADLSKNENYVFVDERT